MIRPAHLSTGDVVRIVPTARAITKKELDTAIGLLESWGLVPELASNVGKRHFQFAGSDSERAEAFRDAWTDANVKAIWCARGGYGTVRMLQEIKDIDLSLNPKWVVGFSDITALHNHLHNSGVMSIHAQMPFAIEKKSQETKDSLMALLFGNSVEYEAKADPLNVAGEAVGTLIGGNLSVLYSLRGGDFDLNVRNRILFLEDLDELLYHVDRMAQNLKAGSWHKQVSGVIVGGMTAMWDKDPKDPFGAQGEQIIHEVFASSGIPVAFGFPAGHLDDNRALVFGEKVKLSVDAQGTRLSFIERSEETA